MTVSIYRGDDTSAFGHHLLKVNLKNPIEGFEISKAEIRVGNLPVRVFENPVFPLYVDLNECETLHLQRNVNCYMAVYDSEGKKSTCEGTVKFTTENKVV